MGSGKRQLMLREWLYPPESGSRDYFYCEVNNFGDDSLYTHIMIRGEGEEAHLELFAHDKDDFKANRAALDKLIKSLNKTSEAMETVAIQKGWIE